MSTATVGQIAGLILSALAIGILAGFIANLALGVLDAIRTRRDRRYTGRDPNRENV